MTYSNADMIVSMSKVCFFLEVAVVVFIFLVRYEMIVFGRVEDWSVEVIILSLLK